MRLLNGMIFGAGLGLVTVGFGAVSGDYNIALYALGTMLASGSAALSLYWAYTGQRT